MTPTERARLREQCRRYGKAAAGSAEHRNLQALLAAAVPRLLDEIDRMDEIDRLERMVANMTEQRRQE